MSRLDEGLRFALEQVPESGDLSALPDAVRIVVLVHAAQGSIDNGGLQFFFENDFPTCPPYSVFVEAYRAIGAVDAADRLERAVSSFPFADPHRARRARNEFLDSVRRGADDPTLRSFEELSNELCGDPDVWERLGHFVEAHATRFGLARARTAGGGSPPGPSTD